MISGLTDVRYIVPVSKQWIKSNECKQTRLPQHSLILPWSHVAAPVIKTLSMNTRVADVDTVLQFFARALCKQSFVSTELHAAACPLLPHAHPHAHKIQTYTCLEMHIILSVCIWLYLVFQSFPTRSQTFLSEVSVIESLLARARLQSVQPRSVCQYFT